MSESEFVHQVCAGACGDQKDMVVEPMELELQAVVSCHVYTGNRTRVLCKRNKHSQSPSHLSTPDSSIKLNYFILPLFIDFLHVDPIFCSIIRMNVCFLPQITSFNFSYRHPTNSRVSLVLVHQIILVCVEAVLEIELRGPWTFCS